MGYGWLCLYSSIYESAWNCFFKLCFTNLDYHNSINIEIAPRNQQTKLVVLPWKDFCTRVHLSGKNKYKFLMKWKGIDCRWRLGMNPLNTSDETFLVFLLNHTVQVCWIKWCVLFKFTVRWCNTVNKSHKSTSIVFRHVAKKAPAVGLVPVWCAHTGYMQTVSLEKSEVSL